MHIFRFGRLEVVKYLIEVQGCYIECTDDNGQTPLHLACLWVFTVMNHMCMSRWLKPCAQLVGLFELLSYMYVLCIWLAFLVYDLHVASIEFFANDYDRWDHCALHTLWGTYMYPMHTYLRVHVYKSVANVSAIGCKWYCWEVSAVRNSEVSAFQDLKYTASIGNTICVCLTWAIALARCPHFRGLD